MPGSPQVSVYGSWSHYHYPSGNQKLVRRSTGGDVVEVVYDTDRRYNDLITAIMDDHKAKEQEPAVEAASPEAEKARTSSSVDRRFVVRDPSNPFFRPVEVDSARDAKLVRDLYNELHPSRAQKYTAHQVTVSTEEVELL